MDHKPRKRFGQNFLHDPGVIHRIVGAIAPTLEQHLVEIGPGQGAISAGLLKLSGFLDVIELDRDLIEPLAQVLGTAKNLRIHSGDALKFDLCPLATDGERLRVIGNLPYNISTPLLFRFLHQADCIQDMHLMLQKEVVQRIIAEPGSRVYGRLSVMVQAYCQAWSLFDIGRGAFTPAPKVDSALMRLIPRRRLPEPIHAPKMLSSIVAAAFSQRRKTLRNSLKKVVDLELVLACGIDPTARAETLGPDTYIRLANAACKSSHST